MMWKNTGGMIEMQEWLTQGSNNEEGMSKEITFDLWLTCGHLFTLSLILSVSSLGQLCFSPLLQRNCKWTVPCLSFTLYFLHSTALWYHTVECLYKSLRSHRCLSLQGQRELIHHREPLTMIDGNQKTVLLPPTFWMGNCKDSFYMAFQRHSSHYRNSKA